MHFYDKFKILCDQKGVEEATAYKDMGINKGTVSIWRTSVDKNKSVIPSSAIAIKMVAYFGCSFEYLFYENCTEKNPPAVSSERIVDKRVDAIDEMFGFLTPDQKDMMIAQLKVLKEQKQHSQAENR